MGQKVVKGLTLLCKNLFEFFLFGGEFIFLYISVLELAIGYVNLLCLLKFFNCITQVLETFHVFFGSFEVILFVLEIMFVRIDQWIVGLGEDIVKVNQKFLFEIDGCQHLCSVWLRIINKKIHLCERS